MCCMNAPPRSGSATGSGIMQPESTLIFIIYIFFDTEDYKLPEESVSQRCTYVSQLYYCSLLRAILCDLSCVPTPVQFPSRIPLRIFAEREFLWHEMNSAPPRRRHKNEIEMKSSINFMQRHWSSQASRFEDASNLFYLSNPSRTS